MQTLFLNGNVQIRFTCYLSVLGNGSETTTVEIFQKLVYKVVTGGYFNINNMSRASKNMRFVKHTQQERVGISGKINDFAEVYPKMNVQVDMRD